VVDLLRAATSESPPLFAEGVECAFAASELGMVEELLQAVERLKPAQLLPLLDAEATRARARLAAHSGDLPLADQQFRRAIGLFRELQTPFYLARAQLEYAELLTRDGRDPDEVEALGDEARAVLESLEAKPWLARAAVARERGGGMSACSACGTEAIAGERHCGQCGALLALTCSSCGAESTQDHRFCGSCGTALSSQQARPAVMGTPQPVSERRLVSVLFADLVGFTALAEHRDPEEVRELLSRYFDRCRMLIGRYGGTVEKFIGDAVMAVWGTPPAREDDAERSVRAAPALTQTVGVLGQELRMPELKLRAGVLTGSAAVEVGADAKGMVLGDTVTASRLQSIAAPGSALTNDGMAA